MSCGQYPRGDGQRFVREGGNIDPDELRILRAIDAAWLVADARRIARDLVRLMTDTSRSRPGFDGGA